MAQARRKIPGKSKTSEQLLAINDDLHASYILTADIDLSGYESWPMIGMYVMDENSPEGEDPLSEFAFTGTFDGEEHTISNLTLDASGDMARMFGVGLFSCVAEGGVVKNFALRDVNVKGMMLVGGVVGGLTCSECVNCNVEYTDITAAPGGNSGILGGGFSEGEAPRSFLIDGCEAANVTITTDADDLSENATGLLVGMAASSQFMGADGAAVDIVITVITADQINTAIDASSIRAAGETTYADAALVDQVCTAE